MDRPSSAERYSRQILFPGIGEEGQERIRRSRAAVAGVGALGSVSASILARAGVGFLRLVDRDVIEPSNLQRQFLYTEEDVRSLKPKAVAARDHLRAANSDVEIEAVVADLNPDNAVRLLTGVDLVLDGTDNFETRFLINEVSVRHGVPWIYAACLGSYGVTMSIIPGETACLSCLMETSPAPGTVPTCETAGIIAPAVSAIASLQATEAIKYLAGRSEEMSGALVSVDVWTQQMTRVEVLKGAGGRRCPTCDGLEFPHLSGKGTRPAILCGREAVQVTPSAAGSLDLRALADRLRAAGPVEISPFILRFSAEGCALTVFPDGRAIVAGTKDPGIARALYARYIGS